MVPPRKPPTDAFEDEEPEEEGWPEDEGEQTLSEEPEPDFDEEVVEEEEEEEEEVAEKTFAEPESFEEEEFEEGEAEEGEEEALDELEAEELDMLTDDEAAESLPVDEVEELRKLRREAIELELEADAVGEDEFVCANCFLVKRMTQLADKRRKLCRDCV
jgi:hypothetical protein